MRSSSRRGLALARWRLYLYGIDNRGDAWGLLAYGLFTTAAVVVLVCTFSIVVFLIKSKCPWLPAGAVGFLLGFTICLFGLLALAYWITYFNLLWTSLTLRFIMSKRIVSKIDNWPNVNHVLDVGCGKGQLLNTVARKLKKEGAGGRVVGVDIWLSAGATNESTIAIPLRAAAEEGVGSYVTCKSGNATDLPFPDSHFDAVVSGLHLHNIGQELTTQGDDKLGSQLRRKALGEMIRVAKPGAPIVIWDILYAEEYATYFKEKGVVDITISDPVKAFMLPSHIVFGKVPSNKSRPK